MKNSPKPHCANPAVPGELAAVDALAAWIEREMDGDPIVAHVLVAGDAAVRADFSLLELSESRVEGCRYAACDFSRASFADVAFSGCDFSNSDFSEANFTEAVLARTELRDSTLSYASLAKARLTDVLARADDFSHADLSEARLARTAFDDVRFTGTSFFRTSLAGIDFTTCQLADIMLSDAMGELKGCRMDLYQAAGIAQRLGVVIAD